MVPRHLAADRSKSTRQKKVNKAGSADRVRDRLYWRSSHLVTNFVVRAGYRINLEWVRVVELSLAAGGSVAVLGIGIEGVNVVLF